MRERTLCIFKPDLAARPASMRLALTDIISAGLLPIALKTTTLTWSMAHWLYQEHEGRPYFEPNLHFVTSGPVVVMVLEGDDAVASLRQLMGPTDPKKASPATLRGHFGSELPRNAVHGSATVADAGREIKMFFGEV